MQHFILYFYFGDPRWSDKDGHGEAYERNLNACKTCHGTVGTALAQMSQSRTIGRVTLNAGEQALPYFDRLSTS
jgi:hypothetical protein